MVGIMTASHRSRMLYRVCPPSFTTQKSRLRSRAPTVAPYASGRRCGTTRRVSADFSFQIGVTFRDHNGTRAVGQAAIVGVRSGLTQFMRQGIIT